MGAQARAGWVGGRARSEKKVGSSIALARGRFEKVGTGDKGSQRFNHRIHNTDSHSTESHGTESHGTESNGLPAATQ
eukprot:353120-Chlamydomonas_euryale.AAC.2